MEKKRAEQMLAPVCGSAIFAGVDEIVAERVITDNRCVLRRLAKGERLDGGDGLGIVLTGQMRLEKPLPDGKRMKLALLSPGGCLLPASGGIWLSAAGSTEVLLVPDAVLRWAMQRNFTVTENYIRFLTDQIHRLGERLSVMTGGTAKQRLAAFLDTGCDGEGVLRITMTELGRQLNVGRATVYRALGALEEQGLVRTGGKTIRLLDREALRREARGSSEARAD